MSWNRNLTNLRNTLAGLYWTNVDARRLAQQAGLNPIFITFDPKPVNTWHAVIETAELDQLLPELITAARTEHPGLKALELAQQSQLLDIQGGEIEAATWMGPPPGGQLEELTGRASTLRHIHFLEAGLDVSRSVCRIVLPDGSKGTGFLIEDNFLLTCHHVIKSEDVARSARLDFNYQKTKDNLDAPSDPFRLAPEDGFVTSPPEDSGGDDWTAVKIRGDANARWGALPLRRAEPKVHDEMIIIQHPGGNEKQIALTHNLLVFANQRRLQYLTDTLSGSSGAPVFDKEWRVLGIHHKGGWLREPGSKSTYYRNQAIHINVLVETLRR